ncbi:glycosyltransferase family 39 protein [Singulisphaera rosea]
MSPRQVHWDRWLLLIGAVVYLAYSIIHATRKPLWYDEIFTFDVASLPRFGDIWKALAVGTDLNPPLYHVISRVSFMIFGTTPLAVRMPAMVGYLIMTLCLYRFVSRRLGPAYAWVAASFPLITQAYPYSFEARPYGLVLGFSGLALVGWQSATMIEGPRRAWALAVMTLALAGALATHYYSVLVFVPLGLGELVRTWTRRKIDWAVWAGLIAGLFPLAMLRELLHAASEFKTTFWARTSWSLCLQVYLFLLKGATIPFVGLLLCLAFMTRSRGRSAGDVERASGTGSHECVPLHEWAAAVGFLLLPFVGIVLAKVATGGAFTERYALPTVLGLALVLAMVGDHLFNRRWVPGAIVAFCFCGWFVLYELYLIKREPDPHLIVASADYRVVSSNDLPLVFSWSIMYLQAQRELTKELSRRSCFLSENKTTDELALRKLSQWVPLNIFERERFLREHDQFYLCGFPGDPTFVALLSEQSKLTLVHSRRFREGEVLLVHVDQKTKAPRTAAGVVPTLD